MEAHDLKKEASSFEEIQEKSRSAKTEALEATEEIFWSEYQLQDQNSDKNNQDWSKNHEENIELGEQAVNSDDSRV